MTPVHLRNGPHGYGAVTKALHWLTVAAIAGQFVVGYRMDVDDALGQGDGGLDAEADRLEDAAEDQGEAAEERAESAIEAREDALDAADDDEMSSLFTDVVTGNAFADGLSLAELHVGLGLVVLALAAARFLWRRTTPLPPWAAQLSAGERRLEARLETVLLALLAIVPVTGILLVLGDDDWLPLHIAAQVALLVTVAVHVALVLKHTVVRRHRHLARML